MTEQRDPGKLIEEVTAPALRANRPKIDRFTIFKALPKASAVKCCRCGRKTRGRLFQVPHTTGRMCTLCAVETRARNPMCTPRRVR